MKFKIPPLREGWSTFFLAWAMVLTAGYAIYQAELTVGMQILLIIGSVGYLAGFALARSRFTGQTAALFALVYGLFTMGYVLGAKFMPPDMLWAERISGLLGQQRGWVENLISGGTNRNPIVFAAHTSLIFWLLGYSAAWYTFRKLRVWRVVLPSGILLLSIVYYYFGPKPLFAYLGLYLIMAMLYITRTYLAEQEQAWRTAAVRYERATTFNFLRAGLGLATAALLVAWMLPTLSASATMNDALSGTNQPWRKFQNNWTRLYSSLRSYGTGVNDPYADSLPLGGPRNVGDSLIMDVYVNEQLPYAYWQSTVFQTYEGGQWRAPEGDRVIHVPDEGLLDVPLAASRQVITQTVLNFLPNSGIIYGMPEIIGTDRQIFVTRQYDERGKSLVNLVQSRYILQQGDAYEVSSRYSIADEKSLREAGQFYPAWTAPYLQVPDSITPQTLALAAEITAPYSSAYDKAIAIQDYLRANIKYNDQIAAPPNEVEPIHYVLFDLKEGYCNYYASAMAIMLRSQGIPARVVAGYAAGQFIEDANVYRVRASDAHTWVEAYFPRYGWVQFEPTASVTTITRPTGEGGDTTFLNPNTGAPITPPLPGRDELLAEDDFLDPNDRQGADLPNLNGTAANSGWLGQYNTVTVWRMIAGVVVILLSAVALYLANILNTRVETDVVQSYDRLAKWSDWLGQPTASTQTPYERAEQLASAVPEGRQPIRNLAHMFVVRSYSPTAASTTNPQTEWRTLRPVLVRHALRRGWERVQRIAQRLSRFLRGRG